MTVYILVEYANGLNHDYKIRGVFASLELAQAERKRLGFCPAEQGESFGWEILEEWVHGLTTAQQRREMRRRQREEEGKEEKDD